MLPFLPPRILYHHILPLLRLWKNPASVLWTLWHPGYDKNIFIFGPLLTWPTYVSKKFGVFRGSQISKIGLAMGVLVGVLLQKLARTLIWLIMRVRLLQKIGLHNLTNQTRFKNGNIYKRCTKIIHDYCGTHITILTRILLLRACKYRPPGDVTRQNLLTPDCI